MENLDYCIDYLLKESNGMAQIPNDLEGKINLWRSLVNVRLPFPISEEYLAREDLFLKDYYQQFEIMDVYDIEPISHSKIALFLGDITKIKIDAIVNPANEQGLGCFLALHSCLDNQITTFAGVRLRLEDKKEMDKKNNHLDTSDVFITDGYNLPAKKVIHTVGPIIEDMVYDVQVEELKKCYINCMELARKNQVQTIAFPSISTGVFHFPKDLAAQIAVHTLIDYLSKYPDSFEKVVIVAYTNDDYQFYQNAISML